MLPPDDQSNRFRRHVSGRQLIERVRTGLAHCAPVFKSQDRRHRLATETAFRDVRLENMLSDPDGRAVATGGRIIGTVFIDPTIVR